MRRNVPLSIQLFFLATLPALLTGMLLAQTHETPTSKTEDVLMFSLTSPAFQEGGHIPSAYTCDGKDISPALKWENPPEGTAAFALICDDPDAPVGTWVHWVIYNIPADYRRLPEGISSEPKLQDGMLQGKNSWNRFGYGGPCPPGGTHRYFFKLYALDSLLAVSEGLTIEALLERMKGHVLGECQLMGRYARKK